MSRMKKIETVFSHKYEKMSLLLLFLLTVMACQGQSTLEQGIQKYVPQKVGVWTKKDAPLEYVGDNLFAYINGGAEIYEEYGFARVFVQDYANRDNKTITLELYEMTSPESAYGMFTFKSSRDGKELSLGNQGRLEDYYLNFWKGRFLVTLTGFDAEPDTLRGLEEIAGAVDQLLQDSDLTLFFSGLFPSEHLIRTSIKYFKGHLGFFNSYALSQKDVFMLKEGVRADYSHGVSVFIFRYDSQELCSQAFSLAQDILLENAKHKPEEAQDKDVLFWDAHSQMVLLRAYQNYILMTTGNESYANAQELLKAVENRIKEQSG